LFVLGEKLLQYQKQGFISFHTPGHKGKREFFSEFHFPEQDLTELPGLDMLHAPEGVIAQALKRTAEVYKSDLSFFLVNGATVGNQAMLMTLASSLEGVSKGTKKRVLIERQSHRSVMSGLVLSGLEPEYIPSVVHPDFRLPLGIELSGVSRLLKSIQAVHLTYPSYYGTLSNLHQVIEERDRIAPQVGVFVDQAHGSHYLNALFPKGAIDLGADLVLHSTHKTLSALTQAAVLHVQGTRVQVSALKRTLELLQSSSPSYLLMASLERAVEFALESSRWELLYEAVHDLYRRAGSVVRILNPEDKGKYGIVELDWSKILVNTKDLGISASQCVTYLRDKYRIEPELWDNENILFLLGIGNTPEEVQVLTEGLISLGHIRKYEGIGNQENLNQQEDSYDWAEGCGTSFPPMRVSPRKAYFARKRKIPLMESLGKVIGESISPYPPGVPLIVIGEEITPEIFEVLSRRKGRWQGWEDPGRMVWVIEEE
jgi:arginine/lysine/ornithine decarboxylase